MLPKVDYDALGGVHPKLARGQVWCHKCGHTERVNAGNALRWGWAMHCGETMSLDSPEELAARKKAISRAPISSRFCRPRATRRIRLKIADYRLHS